MCSYVFHEPSDITETNKSDAPSGREGNAVTHVFYRVTRSF